MKSYVAIAAVALATGTALAATAAADGARSHDRHLAQTGTYRPIEGFSRVVAGKRFSGFFTSARGACSVSLIISQADDEGLRTPVQRMQFELSATQGVDISADQREALGMACSVDADALKVASLRRIDARTVQRD